jgi:hypothetical protein
MIQYYLSMYGPVIAYLILVCASIGMYRQKRLLPAWLVGLSSAGLIILKIMEQVITQPQPNYIYDSSGEVLAVTGEFSLWQQAIFWFYPIAIIAISVGVSLLVFGREPLNKARLGTA